MIQGRICARESGRFAGYLAALEGKDVAVTVEKERTQRSKNQNSWYWAAVVPAVTEYLNEARGSSLSREQVHEVLKAAFIGTETTPLGAVPCSSAALDVEKFSTYCERIRAHAASEWGLFIPGPDEAFQ